MINKHRREQNKNKIRDIHIIGVFTAQRVTNDYILFFFQPIKSEKYFFKSDPAYPGPVAVTDPFFSDNDKNQGTAACYHLNKHNINIINHNEKNHPK